MSDKIELLKKVEITFHEKKEQRDVYDQEAFKNMLKHEEDKLLATRRQKKTDERQRNLEKQEELKRKTLKEQQNKRDNMVYVAKKWETMRSTKPHIKRKEKKVEEIKPEEKDFMKFIGAEVLQIMKEKEAADNQSL